MLNQKIILASALAALGALSMSSVPALPLAVATLEEAEIYDIDGGHSSALFKVKHLNVANFYGMFNEIHGELHWNAKDHKATSLKLSIPVASIDSRDEDRDAHLLSEELFDAENHAEFSFESKTVKADADGNLQVSGMLTARGVSKEILFTANSVGEGSDPWGGFRRGYEARIRITRQDFGIGKMMPSAMLGDEVELIVSLECKRR